MILVIDNYDSFTYNLVQYFQILGSDVRVFRNDRISVEEINEMNPEKIVLSPGPGRPENAGITMNVIRKFSGKLPILGVCLGHQAIAGAFGGRIIRAKKLMHGKTSPVTTDGKTIFSGIAAPFNAMRYHSLVVSDESFPECLEITAKSDDGEIMGIRHRNHFTEGIQFHPESILTDSGMDILKNFMSMKKPV
ncbi:MAG: aminodeoxychorismate/anthranilate synthase component II [Firmicutes bacterium]|nr:aminodeoxychorismate/anthranilate synthase component II [Bacillota bacterium]